MDLPNRRIVMISARGPLSTGPEGRLHDDQDGQMAHAVALAGALARLGHVAEVWGVGSEGPPQCEIVDRVVPVRRFAGGQVLIPKIRPCAWISGWVANAAAHLELASYAGVTLVTHGWEAGVAGKLLAEHFALPFVHMPYSLALNEQDQAPSGERGAHAAVSTTRVEDERAVCLAASKIIALTTAQRHVLVAGNGYGMPDAKVALIRWDGPEWSSAAARCFLDALSPLCTPGPDSGPTGIGADNPRMIDRPALLEAGSANCSLVVNDSVL